VQWEPFAGQEALVPVIDEFNAAGHRLPWLDSTCLPAPGLASGGELR
jgi:hypothetical protein